MSKYLLEIGTEEMPYRFIPQAVEQLKTNFENFFETNTIKFGSIDVYATPRRLAVIISDLLDKQPDEEKVVKGPIEKIAYDENKKLTNAALGFARKNGVEEKDLFLQDGYLHAKVFTKGKLTSELLQENVAQLVLKLQGPHFMRWGSFDEKFSRPIRWIVSILDDKEIPVQILDAKSSKFTRGHRFSDTNVEIKNADEYIEKLRKAHVIVDQNERKNLIIHSAKAEADKLGAVTNYDEDLLDEVTYLCEYPVPVVCDFREKYLDIPEKVTVTVMAVHQRYFALFKNGKLLNKFITITNFLGNDFSNIKAGNERVITARLDDAIFFFKEDTKKPFETYIEKLNGMTFQKGMGSVYDKTQRIINLSKTISDELSLRETQAQTVRRTAQLCKADLVTSLVYEFTELQGYIGADYARVSGEDDKVCRGIKEHYFPLNAESELAESIEGQIVGIADKLDTICAVFASGRKPTGSSDPLGVRRAALGIIKTIIDKNLILNLSGLIAQTIKLLPKQADVIEQVEEFFVQRLIIFMADTYRKDILEACSKNTNPLLNLCDFVERVKLIAVNIEKPEFLKLNESANRITRILKETVDKEIDEKLLTIDAEKQLFSQMEKIKDLDELLEGSYTNLITNLVLINPAIEKFFEDVLVMDKDEIIKQNRLAMLSILKKKYDLLADFSALQI